MCVDDKLYEMIFKRKSFHLFRNIGEGMILPQELKAVEEKHRAFAALYPDIKTALRIVPAGETSCKRGQFCCALLYSEKKEGFLQNIGYIGEQLDLYLASQNIGALWYGMGKPEQLSCNGLPYVITLAMAKVDDVKKFRKDMFKSKRKALAEIWRGEPLADVGEIARFAPSACNTQPWRVEHRDGALTVYRYKKPGKRGVMPADKVSFYNQIDLGIFLCFLELCLQHRSLGYRRELFIDRGLDEEMTRNAVYYLMH